MRGTGENKRKTKKENNLKKEGWKKEKRINWKKKEG